MTPNEHYEEAERLIEVGETVAVEIRQATSEERRDALGKQAIGIWAQAQAHATLAHSPLARVRELADEWEQAAAKGGPRNYAAGLFATAARDLRRALKDGGQ